MDSEDQDRLITKIVDISFAQAHEALEDARLRILRKLAVIREEDEEESGEA